MGSSASKAARGAGAAARRYPKTPFKPSAPPAGHTSRPSPTVRPRPQVSTSRDEAINVDGSDPQYFTNLRQLGAVQPQPHFSPSSTSPFDPAPMYQPHKSSFPSPSPDGTVPSNAALNILSAREKVQRAFDEELTRSGKSEFEGRSMLDVVTVRQMLVLRDRKGQKEEEVERQFGVKPGTLKKLGRGVVEPV